MDEVGDGKGQGQDQNTKSDSRTVGQDNDTQPHYIATKQHGANASVLRAAEPAGKDRVLLGAARLGHQDGDTVLKAETARR